MNYFRCLPRVNLIVSGFSLEENSEKNNDSIHHKNPKQTRKHTLPPKENKKHNTIESNEVIIRCPVITNVSLISYKNSPKHHVVYLFWFR